MNAHTTIIKRHRPFGTRLRTRAFREGLREGFGAISLVDSRNGYNFLMSIDASVADAWESVGEALSAAVQAKEVEIGKTARKTEAAK